MNISTSSSLNSPIAGLSNDNILIKSKGLKLRGSWSDKSFQKFVAFLNKKHPQKTADYVACESGISVKTIQSWLRHETRPSFTAIFLLIEAYGPEILMASIEKPPHWLHRLIDIHKLEEDYADILHKFKQLNALREK